MLTTLTATFAQAPAGREWGARAASLVLHAGLIALAVWWTTAPPASRAARNPQVPLVFWPVPHHAAPAPQGGMAPRGLTAPPVPVPLASPALPPIEAPPTPGWPTAAVEPFPGAPGTGPQEVSGPPSPPSAAPMDVRAVEEAPVLLSHPAPGYPDLMRRAGIGGRVVVEAVVDTAGRVERGSLRIVSSTHALFVPEASALVLGSRYRPARFGGTPVRVRVQVPVEFVLRR